MKHRACLNCCREIRIKSRGLCSNCYRHHAGKYVRSERYRCSEVPDFYGRAEPPPAPTCALPGTPEKVAVLEKRARMRVSLWHPEDARMRLA